MNQSTPQNEPEPIKSGSYIQTYTGKRFYLENLEPDEIDILDIAHALSNTCRFTGHTRWFYSVAQHSVLVSHQVPAEDALSALLHDASEAYLADVSRPVKLLSGMEAYHAIEATVMQAIAKKYGFAFPLPESVKIADGRMLFTEKRDLLRPLNWRYEIEPYPALITPVSPQEAKQAFLSRFRELINKRLLDNGHALGFH